MPQNTILGLPSDLRIAENHSELLRIARELQAELPYDLQLDGRPNGPRSVVDALLPTTEQRSAVYEKHLSFYFAGGSFMGVNLRYLNLANGGPGLTAMLRHRSVKLWDGGLFQLALEPTAGMCRPGCSAGRWPELTWRAAPHTVPVIASHESVWGPFADDHHKRL